MIAMSYSSRIEIAEFEDTEEIVSFLESVDLPTGDVDPDFTRFFIVRDENEGNIIGCVALELFTGTALLRSFAIKPEYQETDLGSSLVKRLIDEAFEAGSDAVYVCASKAPEFFWKNEFAGIDLDDVPEEIRDSKLFIKGESNAIMENSCSFS